MLFHGHSGYTNALVITYIACLGCLAVNFSGCETHPASWSPKQPHLWCVFTCVLHSEASNTSAWYVPVIQVATCIKCNVVTCDTPLSRIRLVRSFDLSYLLFCIYSLYQDWGNFHELTDRLPRTVRISLHRYSLLFLFIWSFCSNERWTVKRFGFIDVG